MTYTLILHIQNADSIIGEVDELPTLSDRLIHTKNPRRVDGKELHYLNENAVSVFWPIERLNFIEVLASE